MFQFTGAAITDVGLRRSSNQDSYLYSEELGLYVVADGMGGHSGGETASRIAVETLLRFYTERADSPSSADPLKEVELLRQAVETANRAIYDHAQNHAELRGMGTTLVALRVRGQTGFVAHVGDSRLYRIDVTGLRRVTKDHSRVQELIDAKQLTESEAQSILGRNIITRALGNRPHVEVDTQILDLRADEGYLLCSDGLCGVLSDEESYAVARSTRPVEPATLGSQLIERVKQHGAPDNVTVLLLLGNRYAEERAKADESLERFDLYPDTQKLVAVSEPREGGDEEPREDTKPVLLTEVENGDRAQPVTAQSGEPALSRGGAEALARLETLVQGVAAERGVQSGSDGSRPDVSALGEQDATQRLTVQELEDARSQQARGEPKDGPPRASRVASTTGPTVPSPAPAPRGRRSLLPVLGLAAVLVAGIGYVVFGPAQSRFLVVDSGSATGALGVSEVGLPFGTGLGESLLGSPLGGILTALRTSGVRELTLPEAVPAEVWKELHGCPECEALGSSGKLITPAVGSIETFAARLFSSLGDYYRDKRLHEKARAFYNAAEASSSSADIKSRLARDYYIEGIDLQEAKRYGGALGSYQRALELGGVEADLEARLAAVAFEQGNALLASGRLSEARDAFRLAEKHGFPKKEELERLLEQAGSTANGAEDHSLQPKLEVKPPELPQLKPPAGETPAPEKEELDDPFREKPDGDSRSSPRKVESPVRPPSGENQGRPKATPVPGRGDSNRR